MQSIAAEREGMTLRCKHCGAGVSLTERESAQIIKDWDRRLSWEEQARLTLQAVCSECWGLLAEQQADEAAGRRVQIIRAAA
jgi:DNA-directed RNA polymerase subunit RPC12/RpoP